jgi:NAD(P)-dependent dehydrogenase (short-subunit alcohol dehydrogenase family)
VAEPVDLLLSGRRAVVTGAGRGIGLAVADTLAAEGVDVVLVARDQEALDRAAERVSRHGRRVLALTADTTDDTAVRAMAARAIGELGGIDILVNCAAQPATGASTALADLRDEDLRVEIETKVLGYLRCARALAPDMKARGWGRIINVSGLAARQTGSPFGSIRNVAVAERTPGLLAERAEALGVTAAEAEARVAAGISIGRIVTAEEIADVVTFLASPRSVAVTGDAVAVGGGTRGPIHY